jgi:hypothetical protein
MGTPSQIGGLGLGATAGGSLMQAFGGLASGFANKDMYDYQASIARLNEQIDKQNAEFAVQQGEQQALKVGMQGRFQAGQIKIGQASSGFDVNSGSNKQVQQSQHSMTMLDTDIVRSNASKTAYGFREQGAVAEAQSNLYTMAGNNAMEAGFMNFGTSILGGASSVSSEWLRGQQMGLWGSADSSTTYANPMNAQGFSIGGA